MTTYKLERPKRSIVVGHPWCGSYKCGPAKVWVCKGPIWWATVKFRSQEKDFEAKTFQELSELVVAWVNAAPELKA